MKTVQSPQAPLSEMAQSRHSHGLREISKDLGESLEFSSSSILPSKSNGEASKGTMTSIPSSKGKGNNLMPQIEGKGKGLSPKNNPPSKGTKTGGTPSTHDIHSKSSSYRSRQKPTNFFIQEEVNQCRNLCSDEDKMISNKPILPTLKGGGKGKHSGHGRTLNVNNVETMRNKGKGSSQIWVNDPIETCCHGGVSFLKLTFIGKSHGKLTILPHDTCRKGKNNRSKQIVGKGGKGETSSSLGEYESNVRFVNCNDPCTDSISGTKCNQSKVIEDVYDGKAICLGSWDSVHEIISFHDKLPKSIYLSFQDLSANVTESVYFGNIHTSCSKPIYPPFAVVLGKSACDESLPFHMKDRISMEDQLILLFDDGISAGFYNSDRPEEENLQFKYNFEGQD